MRMRNPTPLAVVAVLCAAALAGCSGSQRGAADKAGGGQAAPVVLRLGFVSWVDNGDDAQLLQQLAADVDKRSGGRLRVRLLDEQHTYKAPDEEVRLARGVRDGRFDLGWISTRRWDDLGVRSFQALQVPFLITDYATMDAVVRSRLAGRMLAGLERYAVVGLALVPRTLLHPVGSRPLLAPADYRGMQFLVARSRATDKLLAAFGAKVVYRLDSVTSRGRPGAVLPFGPYVSEIATGNVVLYARFGTLFANRSALRRLSDEQRSVLRSAARALVDRSIATTPSEQVAVRATCQNGSIALAGRADLARLRAAARPVAAALERDPQTKAFVAEIRGLGASTRPGPPLVVPAGCRPHGRGQAPAHSRQLSPGSVNGTYRYVLTRAAATAFGPPATDPNGRYPLIVTVVLRDGEWESSGGGEISSGTYTLTRTKAAFAWPRAGYTIRFSYTREANGTLHLKPVLPMDLGDQFVWASQPWRRIGPPPG